MYGALHHRTAGGEVPPAAPSGPGPSRSVWRSRVLVTCIVVFYVVTLIWESTLERPADSYNSISLHSKPSDGDITNYTDDNDVSLFEVTVTGGH